MRTAYIIDDHSDTADALQLALGIAGYKAEKFTTLDDCWKHIVNDQPCLVIMDWHMNDSMSPVVFISLVQSKFPNLAIYVLSGDQRLRDKVTHLGVKFLLKPCKLDEIQEICAQ